MSSTDTLAAYLIDTHDAKGVVAFIREQWPKSLGSYVSQTKKQWMTLNVISEAYAAQFLAAVAIVDDIIASAKTGEKEVLRNARKKLIAFNDTTLTEKHTVQRHLRSGQYSGHAIVDDPISAFTIFPAYITDLKVNDTERAAMQRQATTALEAKSIQSIPVQASELISKCRATLKDTRVNPFDIAAAIGLLTGRRTIEIFKTATFEMVSEHAVSFTGQAKKYAVSEPTSYEIPVLAPPDLINTALARLRTLKDCTCLTNREVNLRYANSANAAACRL
jgi:Telomere resolvase